MSNIIGDPFSPYVKNQIEARQKALGQLTNISADNLKYYTTKTPWLRLASTINLEADPNANSNNVLDKLVKAGVPQELIEGDKLAKNFILQGGTLGINDDGSTNLKKGLNYDNELFNGAYGWGGISERGFVPMPGIIQASTTYLNNGALAKAEITIKCFSKTQFQLLDVLYLRPGYTLLLEFGWSTFLNSQRDSNQDGNVDETDVEIGALRSFDGFKSTPLDFVLKPGSFEGDKNQYQLLQLMNAERKKYCGNYEAVYGKITNFKWNFESDGSYTCTVHLIGMGSIIESLKLNVSDPNKNNQSEDNEEKYAATYEEFIIAYVGQELYELISAKKSPKKWTEEQQANLMTLTEKSFDDLKSIKKLKKFLKKEYEAKKDSFIEIEKKNINNNPLLANKDDTRLNKIFYNVYQTAAQFEALLSKKEKVGGSLFNTNDIKNGGYILGNTLNGEQSIVGMDKADKSVFIKFGVLLKIIEENCNLFSKKGVGGTPSIKFDFAYQNLNKDNNFMLVFPPNISTNPKICLVPYNKMATEEFIPSEEDTDSIAKPTNLIQIAKYLAKGMAKMKDIPTDTDLNSSLKGTNFLVKDNKYIGRLGNVLINLRFCSEALSTSQKGDDGGISVLSYLQTILKGINEVMGSINNFLVTHEESTGVIKIYDESPKPGLVENIPSKFTKINTFGVKQNQGSFVRNISLNAEIPKEFATMLAIGAQASGNNLQGNATSFSNYNLGLIDRVIPEKVDYESKKNPEEGQNNVSKAMKLANEKIYFPTTSETISPFASIYIPSKMETGQTADTYNFTEKVCKDLTENYTSYLKLVQGILSEGGIIPSPFFLPFNLNLEMEGLSGMRLYEKFRISDDILPPSYEKDNVDIIIKAVNHSVNVQSWTTTIDTLSVPRHEPPKQTGKKKPIVKKKSEKQEKLEEVADPNREPRVNPTLLTISAAGVEEIKRSEAFRANSYYDSVGVLTIGYGTTENSFNDPYEWDDLIYDEQPITEERATELLMMHVQNEVQTYIYSLVKVDLTQNEFDALVSFIYNVGSGNFKSSTLLRVLNKENYEEAANQFLVWNKGGGQVLAGLTKRRSQERELFLT